MNGRETEEEENRSHRDKENGVRSEGGCQRREKRESVVRVSERNGNYVNVCQGRSRQAAEDLKLRSEPKKQPQASLTTDLMMQVFAAVSVSTGCLSFGLCMAYTSSAIPSMMESSSAINITDSEASWMSSLLCIGALFGSLSAVFLMDTVGRKASLLAFSVMSLFIGWTLLMAASQAWQLYVGRFLLGLGAGLEISISPVYIHETSRANMRDICGSFPQVMTALGIVICYFMGRSLAWNWLSLAALIFLIPFVFGLYYIPESPPWLVYNEEEDLAFRSMSQIRGEEYDATKEIRHIKDLLTLHQNDLHALVALDSEMPESEVPNNRFRFKDIFQKSVLHPFLVILVLMFLLQFSGQGAVTFYTVQIFTDACSQISPKDCALTIGVTYFLSALLSLVLKNLVGRRLLMLVSLLGMAVSQIALGAYFSSLAQYLSRSKDSFCEHNEDLNSDNDTQSDFDNNNTQHETELTASAPMLRDIHRYSWLPLPLLMCFTVAFNLGLGSLTWVVATEILPVRSRGYTHTIANVTSNFCWFIITKTFRDIQASLGLAAPFFMYGSVSLLGLVFIFIFLPETRGRTFEETASEFQGFRPLRERIGCNHIKRCIKEGREGK